GFTYYKMGNLDNRIANADQLLTQDVEKFCNSVVDLYSNLSKPLLDIVLYIVKLTSAIGAQGPAIMMAYLLISGLFLTRLRRPTGKMTVTEQRYEGEYRYVNSRLITNSEEIAFYNGNMREKQTIHATFKKLVRYVSRYGVVGLSSATTPPSIVCYYTSQHHLLLHLPVSSVTTPPSMHCSSLEVGVTAQMSQ
ncbi:ATP-binding cassette sub- D member 3, partial [Ataeniobius toweri]|nr:ATP-binding cassette sub- D member 3 [Ataeniobius toweri]